MVIITRIGGIGCTAHNGPVEAAVGVVGQGLVPALVFGPETLAAVVVAVDCTSDILFDTPSQCAAIKYCVPLFCHFGSANYKQIHCTKTWGNQASLLTS